MRGFNTNQKVLIPYTNITHISKKVTEPISSKYLQSFLLTTALQENYPITSNSKVIYHFIQKVNIYEIYIFESSQNNPLLEFQLFENYPFVQSQKNKYYLFITKNFFVVYFGTTFFLSLENKNYTKEDIVKFVEFTYKIPIKDTVIIEPNELETLKQNIQNLKPLPFIKLQTSKEFYYYLAYIVGVILFCFYFYYQNIPQNQVQPTIQLEDKNYQNKQITLKIATFIKNLSIHNIQLEQLQYEKKLKTTMIATNQNLSNFLTLYKKTHKIIKLEKLDNNLFLMEVEIEL